MLFCFYWLLLLIAVAIAVAVGITSASSERIFSKARRIITGDRNRLSPEIAGTLFYINDNLEWYEGQQ